MAAAQIERSWVFRFAATDAGALAPLRVVPQLEAASSPQTVWLRGPPADGSLAAALFSLPATARYERLPDDRLRPWNSRIPSERMPDLTWVPLAQWCQVSWPARRPAGQPPHPVRLHLVPSADEKPADLLLTELDTWTQFATKAAQVRLGPLKFAASGDRRVLVRGTPLPPLPGQRWVLYRSLAVPAGFSWEPAVPVEVVEHLFGASPEGLILWPIDGAVGFLHSDQFVPASRAAARATQAAVSGAP
jgi:hypothetical protein